MTIQEFTDKVNELIFVEIDEVKDITENKEGEFVNMLIKFENDDIFKITVSK